MNDKITTGSTITRLLLREYREERGFTQQQIASILGMTTSSWTKIENGSSPLLFDYLIAVCSALQLVPSELMKTVERYSIILSARGWKVHFHGSKDIDALVRASKHFYEKVDPRSRAELHAKAASQPFSIGDMKMTPVFEWMVAHVEGEE